MQSKSRGSWVILNHLPSLDWVYVVLEFIWFFCYSIFFLNYSFVHMQGESWGILSYLSHLLLIAHINSNYNFIYFSSFSIFLLITTGSRGRCDEAPWVILGHLSFLHCTSLFDSHAIQFFSWLGAGSFISTVDIHTSCIPCACASQQHNVIFTTFNKAGLVEVIRVFKDVCTVAIV